MDVYIIFGYSKSIEYFTNTHRSLTAVTVERKTNIPVSFGLFQDCTMNNNGGKRRRREKKYDKNITPTLEYVVVHILCEQRMNGQNQRNETKRIELLEKKEAIMHGK